MNDTITVGVTGAPASHRAIDWAVRRAEARSQRLELVAVVGGALGTVGEDAVVEDALAATDELLEAQAERIRAAAPSVPVAREQPRPPIRTHARAERHSRLPQ